MRVITAMGLFLSLLVPSGVIAQTPGPVVNPQGKVNYKALRAACNGAPPFAVKFNGAKIVGEASLTPTAVKAILTRVSGKLANVSAPSLDANTQAVLANERVGVTFDTAFREVATSYFCMLGSLYAGDQAKLDALSAAEEFVGVRLLLEITSPANYKDSTTKSKVIAALISEAKALKPAFTKGEVARALGDYKFDAVTKVQVDAVAKSPGLGQISVCGGVLSRSQADIDNRVLNGLEGFDTGLQNLLSGSGQLTVATMASLGQQLYEGGNPAARLTVNDILCVQKANVEVKNSIKDDSAKPSSPITPLL